MELSNELRAKIKELLKFVEYLQLHEDSSFIEYITERTRQTVQDKKRGKPFTSLEELQRDYACFNVLTVFASERNRYEYF